MEDVLLKQKHREEAEEIKCAFRKKKQEEDEIAQKTEAKSIVLLSGASATPSEASPMSSYAGTPRLGASARSSARSSRAGSPRRRKAMTAEQKRIQREARARQELLAMGETWGNKGLLVLTNVLIKVYCGANGLDTKRRIMSAFYRLRASYAHRHLLDPEPISIQRKSSNAGIGT